MRLLERLALEAWGITGLCRGCRGRLTKLRGHRSVGLCCCRCAPGSVGQLCRGTGRRDGSGGRNCGTRNWSSGRCSLFPRHGGGNGLVPRSSVCWVVLDHPVGCGLPQALGILVDDGLLVVEGLCIVDQALAVALDLSERRVFSAVELVLRRPKLAAGLEDSLVRGFRLRCKRGEDGGRLVGAHCACGGSTYFDGIDCDGELDHFVVFRYLVLRAHC